MNIILRRLVALPAVLVLLAACNEMPAEPAPPSADTPAFNASVTAPANRFVEENLFDMTDTVAYITCEDGTESEGVRLEGKIFERNVLMFTPSGGFLYTWHTMPVGLRGFGVTSGEEYRVSERDMVTGSLNGMGGARGSYRQEIRFFGRESGARFRMIVLGHYTLNADYEFIVDRETARYECDR